MRVVLVLVCVSSLAAAQPLPPPPPARPKVCLRGKRQCESIVLIEAVVGARRELVKPEDFRQAKIDFEFGFGALVNRGQYGIGVTLGGRSVSPEELAVVIRGRYRYWLADIVGLDASLGPMFGAALGASTQIGIEVSDHIALVVDFDIARLGSAFDSSAGSGLVQTGLALRFGGYAAPPGVLAAAGASYAYEGGN